MRTAIFILIATALSGILFSLTSCSDELDIQQAYDFTLTTQCPFKSVSNRAKPPKFAANSTNPATTKRQSSELATSNLTAKAL